MELHLERRDAAWNEHFLVVADLELERLGTFDYGLAEALRNTWINIIEGRAVDDEGTDCIVTDCLGV